MNVARVLRDILPSAVVVIIYQSILCKHVLISHCFLGQVFEPLASRWLAEPWTEDRTRPQRYELQHILRSSVCSVSLT